MIVQRRKPPKKKNASTNVLHAPVSQHHAHEDLGSPAFSRGNFSYARDPKPTRKSKPNATHWTTAQKTPSQPSSVSHLHAGPMTSSSPNALDTNAPLYRVVMSTLTSEELQIPLPARDQTFSSLTQAETSNQIPKLSPKPSFASTSPPAENKMPSSLKPQAHNPRLTHTMVSSINLHGTCVPSCPTRQYGYSHSWK
nr:hypothetical protein CFP56_66040 [Quercus suber]